MSGEEKRYFFFEFLFFRSFFFLFLLGGCQPKLIGTASPSRPTTPVSLVGLTPLDQLPISSTPFSQTLEESDFDFVQSTGKADSFQNGTLTGSLISSSALSLALPLNRSFDPSWVPQYEHLLGYSSFDSNLSVVSGKPSYSNPIWDQQGGSVRPAGPGWQYGGLFFPYLSRDYATMSWMYSPPLALTAYSLSFWFKIDAPNIYGVFPLFTFNGWGPGGIESFSVNRDGVPLIDTQMSNQKLIVNMSTNYADKNWHHIVYTVGPAGSGDIDIYMDGVSVGKAPRNLKTQVVSYLIFGWAYGQVPGFFGTIDEVAFWETALTQSEVQTIYNRQNVQTFTPPLPAGSFISALIDSGAEDYPWSIFRWFGSLPFGKSLVPSQAEKGYGSTVTAFSDQLLSYWNFDELAGKDFVLDSGKNRYRGEFNGSEVILGGEGKLGNSVSFSGSSSFISVPNYAPFAPTDAWTLSAWISLPSTFSYSAPISLANKTNEGIAAPFDWHLNSALLPILSVGDGSVAQSFSANRAVKTGEWSHVAVSWDPLTSTVKHYLNGAFNGSGSLPAGFSLRDGQHPLYLGARSDRLASSSPFKMDEFATWKGRVLGDFEILELYRRAANQVQFQVRSCPSNQDLTTCSAWLGPDGTPSSYYTEASSLLSPAGTPVVFLNGIPRNRYIQYQAFLSSTDPQSVPDVLDVFLGKDLFYRKSQKGILFTTLSGFQETTRATPCFHPLTYQLSLDGSTWYYWNGSQWNRATKPSEANIATQVNEKISLFSAQRGVGSLFVKYYFDLKNDLGSCSLQSLLISGSR